MVRILQVREQWVQNPSSDLNVYSASDDIAIFILHFCYLFFYPHVLMDGSPNLALPIFHPRQVPHSPHSSHLSRPWFNKFQVFGSKFYQFMLRFTQVVGSSGALYFGTRFYHLMVTTFLVLCFAEMWNQFFNSMSSSKMTRKICFFPNIREISIKKIPS